MLEQVNTRRPRVPLSEDPMMDRLEQILRIQRPERREALVDLLDREAAEEETLIVNGGDNG